VTFAQQQNCLTTYFSGRIPSSIDPYLHCLFSMSQL